MEKTAYYLFGKAHALAKLGFAEPLIARVLEYEGMDKEASAGMAKEAIWSTALRAAAKGVGHLAGRYGGRAMAAGARQGGQLGKAMQWGGQQMLGAGKATGQALKGLRTDPMRTLGRGALEAGKGALFFGGKGVGGALGKGVGAYTLGQSLMGPGQLQMPQAYGGVRQPYPGMYGQ